MTFDPASMTRKVSAQRETHTVAIPTSPYDLTADGLARHLERVARAIEDLAVYRDASAWDVPWREVSADDSADGVSDVQFERYV